MKESFWNSEGGQIMREKLIALSMVKKGDWLAIYNFLQKDSKLESIDDIAAYQLVNQLNCEVITIMDDDYPMAWKEMSKPPFVVYFKGNRGLLDGKIIATIGGKIASEYTKKALNNLIRQLTDDISVATGFERGVEIFASKEAKSKIACLATGFSADELYQKHDIYGKLTKDDLVLSELPPNAKFDLQAYYRSYHLIAELSQVVCIFELAGFDLRVKYLNYLTEVGKEVVVLPDRKDRNTTGGLGLINRGAKCLMQVSDVLELLE